ncbi:hypothetical protein [Melittangium boletus]|uniref:hypothetical protein n=1 Tax=Melittangium boletus TaxID=83453 RepID=UPI000BB39F7C|nr:hypothetical protein [Melittangium boletus]
MQVAGGFDKLNVALIQDDSISFSMGEREYLAYQKKLLRQAETEKERHHIKRLIARSILRFAYLTGSTWGEYERALRRVLRLGYLNADHQLSVAALSLLWASDNDHTKASAGWELMEAAERRLRRLRRKHAARRQGLESSEIVRRRVARKGLLPPGSVRPSKGASRRRA